ncbi:MULTISPECIES: DUF3574 domain-containing protein [unclassified Pseudomonas]|uniref:DUF3574 domain-containing protein n=1 Tax=unclassified Pseudomonas TaxID=196821 RepID=UPI0015B25C2D|nr:MULTISPECIES: DUF3574 domain-containing protein [unclassified Pseudomonas]MDW3711059.1 DUF3574 domain-containing protein [Pseudomonas sp. 2023EL-01195]
MTVWKLLRGPVVIALVASLAGAALLLASRSPLAGDGHPREHAMLRTELYFGAIEPAAWERFLAEEVTPRFPDGLSWYDVNGQWRGPSGKPEKLPSRILLLIHADNAANREALAEIGALFLARYGMAVLKVSSPVTASDPDWTDDRVKNRQLAP